MAAPDERRRPAVSAGGSVLRSPSSWTPASAPEPLLPSPPDTLSDLGAAHAHFDPAGLPRGTRGALLKRLFLRVFRVYTRGQVLFNESALRVLDRLDEYLRRLVPHVQDSLETLEGKLRRLADRAAEKGDLDERFHAQEVRIEDLEDDVEELRDARRRLDELAVRASGNLGTEAAADPPRSVPPRPRAEPAPAEILPPGAYLEFENLFRGSRESVLARQKTYVSLLQEAADRVGDGASFLDIGCGRGELLELAREAGLDMTGCDTDPDMVRECRTRGLRAQPGSFRQILRRTGADSLAGVSALQVIEHIPYPEIRSLLEMAHRALKSGGCILLETVNPLSWYAMRFFYADPSHRQPVPNATCEFLVRTAGFVGVETRLLNLVPAEEVERVLGDAARGPLAEFLCGAQDYAVIGVKP